MKGKLDLLLGHMMNSKDPVDITTIKYDYPLALDNDDANQKLRIQFYDKKREMLMKLAQSKAREPVLKEGLQTAMKLKLNSMDVVYDLKRNYGLEWLPTTVINNLKYSYLARQKQWTYLPQFESFTRVASEVTLSVSKLPVRFRDVLCDRAKVETSGTTLIKSILTALEHM